ncbi:hypothetical protein D3M95_08645 [Corynebacterium falsenii]|uniref:Thioredoxin-like fold domain-containing protein n=1 Tax=Corynebacterium falsenii TaxID=108486 RepID=A0A418Q5I7_9CORY|nr:thioredoxin domain-containing protein [Corynebacterium falsenii]RIX33961.1 hypothetical protein D3M95_08645 [Corynebacterium falsenii]
MSQKIKAPNSKNGRGFLWGIIAIIVIAAVVIGFIVVKNKSSAVDNVSLPEDNVNFEVSTEDNAVVMAAKNVQKDAPVVEIFEDFSCPHCADLVKADHEGVLKALDDGKVIVKLRFLNFLDEEDQANKPESGSSTRGAATAWAIAQTGNARAFWNMHDLMMLDQKTVARTWGWDQLGEAASKYDVDGSVVDQIKSGEVKDEGIKVAKANAEDLKKRAGKVSSPIVYVNGKEFQLQSDGNGGLKSWVPEVVK